MVNEKKSIDEVLAETLGGKLKSLSQILTDRSLAKLGDPYLNFVYSLAVSIRKREPYGLRLSNKILAKALKDSGLRIYLPQRLSRHEIGGSAEALLLYSVANGLTSTLQILQDLVKFEDPTYAFTRLLKKIRDGLLRDGSVKASKRET